MAKSAYLRDAIANAVLRNTTFTSPATVYLGLASASPSASSFTGLAGNGYARIAVTFGAPSSGAASNSADAVFAAATGSNWAAAVGFGIFDASSGGNRLHQGDLATPVTANVGDQIRFLTGTLTITES